MRKLLSKNGLSVLILFGIIGQIAWSVENMYFNLFVFETIEPNLNAITLMVQLSGIAATLTTLFAGTLSDKLGNRKSFISIGYIIWGITVMLFGMISPSLFSGIFGISETDAIKLALIAVIAGDCVMTFFGSTANDAAFSAWVTDNTDSSNRGSIESIIAVFPLIALLIVAGGFGILKDAIGYKLMFVVLGGVISACGIAGIFLIKDSETLVKNGTLTDIIYGFKPSTVKNNVPFYMALLITCVYSIACQIFMPYITIYMSQFMGFSVIEYSVIFAVAILLGAGVNLVLGRVSDKVDKLKCTYLATGIFALGLFCMYFSRGLGKTADIIVFAISSFIMIVGYIYISALAGAIVRDRTPVCDTGKLQGVRMIFSVLIPMLAGPAIGNAINAAKGARLPDSSSADTMTTLFIPAPEIFLAAALLSLLMFILIPIAIKINTTKAKE
jgi:MFS family permease